MDKVCAGRQLCVDNVVRLNQPGNTLPSNQRFIGIPDVKNIYGCKLLWVLNIRFITERGFCLLNGSIVHSWPE